MVVPVRWCSCPPQLKDTYVGARVRHKKMKDPYDGARNHQKNQGSPFEGGGPGE